MTGKKLKELRDNKKLTQMENLNDISVIDKALEIINADPQVDLAARIERLNKVELDALQGYIIEFNHGERQKEEMK